MDKKQLQQKLDDYFTLHTEDLLHSISRLVRIRSEKGEAAPGMPYGPGPAEALREALEMAQEMGFAIKNYDNYVGAIDFCDGPRQLDILAHLDCVPVGDDWTVTTPFAPLVQDGRIYGRGTIDDKGPAMCALWAMKAVKDLGIDLSKNVRLIVGTDEESGSSDIAHYYAQEPEAPMTFSPDAEYPVINIEKGSLHGHFTAQWPANNALPRVSAIQCGLRANVVPDTATATLLGLAADDVRHAAEEAMAKTGVAFTLTNIEGGTVLSAKGLAGHASTPEIGNNALTALLALLAALPLAAHPANDRVRAMAQLFPHGDYHGAALGVDLHDEESGWLTLSLNLMELSETGLSATFDSRVALCATEENMTQVVRRRLADAGLTLDPAAKLRAAHYVPADSPFIQTLLACYEQYSGEKGEPLAIGGGTYVHNLQNGVAFGISKMGTDYHMHGADEFAIVDELAMSAKLFAAVIVELCA